MLTGDPTLVELLDEVTSYPNVAQIAPLLGNARGEDPPILVSFRLATPLGELSLFTTLTTFSTPPDVTIDELAIELFFPADDRSDQMLHAMSLERHG